MGKVTFHIHPYEGSSSVRSKDKLKSLLYLEGKAEDRSTWSERFSSCVDPILNKEFGCFSPENDQKISCALEVLPSVMGCLYFGNRGTQYCIPESANLNCKGECGFSQEEVERLYGCVNSYGEPPDDCNAFKDDFCNCAVSDKLWSTTKKSCECEEGKNDYGRCCDEKTCRAEFNESFNCTTRSCECSDDYHRLPFIPSTHPLSEFSQGCAESCAVGASQNNPINYETKVELPGCGEAVGEEGDMCCKDNRCVLDNGTWDGQYYDNPTTKSSCLSLYGTWKITNNNSCPRTGHCEFPMCNKNQAVQILDQFQPDGPAWVMPCESCTAPESAPSPKQCREPCQSFCSSNVPFSQYEKSHCGTVGTSQDTCICHCKTP